jgi:hypothetical protein
MQDEGDDGNDEKEMDESPALSGPLDLANGIRSIHRSDGTFTMLQRY